MRVVFTGLLLLAASSADALAQGADPPFVHGRDYTFERMEATRVVHDADDNGPIQLVTYVYRPLKNDRHQVALFAHGSTGGLTRSPKEPAAGDWPPPSIVQFFVSRGYTLVSPQRRGRGESTGTYVEECSVPAGTCTPIEQLALTDRGLKEAALDVNAAIDQLVRGKLAPRDAKILLVGHSRGGFLDLLLAAERPDLFSAVVNFAGGWHNVNDRLAPEDFQRRVDLQSALLTRAAKQVKIPTIWIYADRDPFYNDAARQALLRAWREAGGHAEYVFIGEHNLPNGHLALNTAPLWSAQLDAFLKTIEAAR
jgi:pimeloyl-ACP methyl ester carboxylesterase